jgi:mycothiol synthase
MADIIIRPLVGSAASDALLHQWYELFAANRGEAFPGFPMPGFEAFAARRRPPAGELDPGASRAWAAWDGELLLGVGTAVYLERDFPEYAVPSVDVHPDHRRRGVGTALLRTLLADASAEGRGMLVQEQVRIGSPGEAWVRATRFTEVLRNRWQMLDVPGTDPARWDVPVPAGFRLAQWVGAAPEPLVAAFAAARNAIGDAPTGESGYEAPEWTVARVREEEARSAAAGESMHHVVAVHEATGAVAALTGVLVMPPRVDLVWQRDTAVAGDFRGRGLGRVVKAAMMRTLLDEHPALGRVVTSTAAHNAAMIRVNERIGYAPYAEIGVFEASVAQLEAALGTAATSVPGPRREAAADQADRRPGQNESVRDESVRDGSALNIS